MKSKQIRKQTPHNRMWYIREEGMVGEGKNYCYAHDKPDCRTCPKCPNHQICSWCDRDVKKHSEEGKIRCLLRLSEKVTNLEGQLHVIYKMVTESQVTKVIKFDDEVAYKRLCKYD